MIGGGEVRGDDTCSGVVSCGKRDGDGVNSRGASTVLENFVPFLCFNVYLQLVVRSLVRDGVSHYVADESSSSCSALSLSSSS